MGGNFVARRVPDTAGRRWRTGMYNGIRHPMRLDQCAELGAGEEAGAIAIVDGDGVATTRGELRMMAEAAACRLVAAGLAPGDRMAVLARKSPQTIAMLLGASLAGIVYVPLDARAEPSYWRTVMSDLGVRALVTDRKMDPCAVAPVRILDIASAAEAAPTHAAAIAAMSRRPRSAEEDAYILTTSGSTGRPKGVLLSHENALSFVDWAIEEVSLSRDDVVLNLAPLHFDLSVFDIYAALLQRARLVLAPELAATFPGLIVEAIAAHRVSVLYTVPTVLRSLLDAGAFVGDAAASLRVVIYAGEPFPAAALARVMRALPHVSFFNFFGPTETNVCLAHRLAGPPSDEAAVPIGTPASSANIRLVDSSGAIAADGEIGEILVDGPTVMKGYVTADGFAPVSRPYATGDYARRGRDQLLYFCGRRDEQVKVRGMRIELGAVDRVLLACPGVKEAAAFVIGPDLVACVSADQLLDEAELMAACRAQLPTGSQPHRFCMLESFPRLSNGKLDRQSLKARAGGKPTSRD